MKTNLNIEINRLTRIIEDLTFAYTSLIGQKESASSILECMRLVEQTRNQLMEVRDEE